MKIYKHAGSIYILNNMEKIQKEDETKIRMYPVGYDGHYTLKFETEAKRDVAWDNITELLTK